MAHLGISFIERCKYNTIHQGGGGEAPNSTDNSSMGRGGGGVFLVPQTGGVGESWPRALLENIVNFHIVNSHLFDISISAK